MERGKKKKKRFHGTSGRGENVRVSLKVSVVDGLDQLLGHFDDLLFASCEARAERSSRTGFEPSECK